MGAVEAAIDDYTAAVLSKDEEAVFEARHELKLAVENYAVEASQDKIDEAVNDYAWNQGMLEARYGV